MFNLSDKMSYGTHMSNKSSNPYISWSFFFFLFFGKKAKLMIDSLAKQ